VRNSVRLIVGSITLAAAFFVTALADDFPLVGNYTQNVACKGDGSDQPSARVTI